MKRDRRNELHRRLQRTEAALSAYRRAADPDVLDQIHRSGGSFGRAMLLATIRAQEVELAEERAFRERVVEAFAKELEARIVIGSYDCQIVNVGICEALRRADLWPEVEARLAELRKAP